MRHRTLCRQAAWQHGWEQRQQVHTCAADVKQGHGLQAVIQTPLRRKRAWALRKFSFHYPKQIRMIMVGLGLTSSVIAAVECWHEDAGMQPGQAAGCARYNVQYLGHTPVRLALSYSQS